jgi:hypothetical protein
MTCARAIRGVTLPEEASRRPLLVVAPEILVGEVA